jgi:hypothetical protein
MQQSRELWEGEFDADVRGERKQRLTHACFLHVFNEDINRLRQQDASKQLLPQSDVVA